MSREPKKREVLWQEAQETEWQLIVIGGGITGAGVAREAVRLGLKTLLIEQQDYAWGTSSRSSKMVHGGLRYIAQGDVKLTWHSLTERERLLTEAPGLVSRMGYWFAHYRHKFPGRFLFGLLLAFYDVLAGINDRAHATKRGFLERLPNYQSRDLTGASRYTDALVDDARLVLRVLDEAVEDGALVLNYVKADRLALEQDKIVGVYATDKVSGQSALIKASVVVNATGAWADRLRQVLVSEKKVRPQRGSHIVLAEGRLPLKEAIIFMHPKDGRPLFIYPWEGRTVAGTTDLDHKTELDEEATITREELDYILQGVNSQFPAEKIGRDDIISTFSGVRPIVDSGSGVNPSAERRDHSIWDNKGLITVTGGKLTTFRLIALDVLKKVANHYTWLNVRDQKSRVFRPVKAVDTQWPVQDLQRIKGRFGFLTEQFLLEMHESEATAIPSTHTLLAELRWALRHEQVVHLDDLLLRRTRLGLLLPAGAQNVLSALETMCKEELGWNDERWQLESQRYVQIWQQHYSLPA